MRTNQLALALKNKMGKGESRRLLRESRLTQSQSAAQPEIDIYSYIYRERHVYI